MPQSEAAEEFFSLILRADYVSQLQYGVLDREKTGRASKNEKFDRFIAVKANICANTYSDNVNIFEVDPDLAENLLDVVREFENPALK